MSNYETHIVGSNKVALQLPTKEYAAQLKEAFEKVQDKEHWKNPINAVIAKADLAITAEAIEYYTSTSPEVVEEYEDGTIKIYALGYWGGPAAG